MRVDSQTELVIAVDISYSMDPDELTLQRQGFAEAFRSAVVQDAIRGGTLGADPTRERIVFWCPTCQR